jgi:hypothetical protein
MVFQRLVGPYGKMPVLIRDDDTNFFTKENMLESIYSEAWEKGFKVCLSVVPFQAGTDEVSVPPYVRNTDDHFSIAENKPLVYYLRDKIRSGTIEVLQHGFSHEVGKDRRGEYGKNSDKNENTELGRNIMRNAFEIDPKFFVPPGEDISKHNLITLIKLGYVPIYRKSLFDNLMRNTYVPSHFKEIAARALALKYDNKTTHGNWAVQFVKPVILHVGDRTISWSPFSFRYANVTSYESLFKLTDIVIKSCSISRDPVCIINHYHLYSYDWNHSITRRDLFHALKKMFNAFDKLTFSWKVTFFELYKRTNQIRNILIIKTGSKITVESATRVQNFSFRTTTPLEPNSCVSVDEENNISTIQDLLPQKKIILYEKNKFV